ncbi:hypothetical protein F0562_029920 [Nyssa sinensis]|uniref:GIY-YIG domain-containing protein n=1 Tax=Nyssa sinensis TaxID=561372 RepID=A0A5J5AWW6_9ASTE|nr:hypothetical protein F0562_029920 [Nyssa sinensis]
MEANKAPVVSTRLRREDCKRTKHDSDFSEWKILIGPSDWEDHSLGKEGASRYRVHNLPNCSSCPGVYELGIAIPHTRSGREVGKVGPDYIIPVYIGQADNVRTRLQRYGQTGAHLENGTSNGELNDCVGKGPGLLTEIFSRGLTIVFRWAPMKNKRDAEKTESRLLDAFDYAWNKGSNGARRPDDIFQKLNQRSSSHTQFPAIVKKLQKICQKQVGVRIKACGPLLLENGSSINTNPESNDLLSRIFKFGRSQPRPVSLKFGITADNDNICGVAIGHGSICRRPAVQGRKRCAEHKGMKVNGSISKFITEGKSSGFHLGAESGVGSNPECDGHQIPSCSFYTEKPQLVAGNCPDTEKFFPICGVTLDDGSLCRSQTLQGRKRCEEHKGRRIRGFISASPTEERQHYVRGPVLKSNNCQTNHEQVSSDVSTTGGLQSQIFSENSVVNKGYASICGVDLEGGTFCTRRPVVGRKRCKEHEGKRVGKSTSKLFAAGDIPSLFDGSGNSASKNQKYNDMPSPSVSYRNVDISSICGATLTNGSFCRRQPVEGRKRCWEHKGMWANSLLARGMMINGTMSKVVEDKSGLFDTSSKISSCNDWKYNYTSSQSVSHKSVVNEDFSSTCGATLIDGSFCRRQPAEGRKRCWQHTSSKISSCNDWKYNDTSSQSVSHKSVVNEDFSSTCGATLIDGSFCRRQPAEGRKRCWQHKGMRAGSSLSYSSIFMYDSEGISSHICGAGLRNGSICNRMPVPGRKRCEQHKGMRAD